MNTKTIVAVSVVGGVGALFAILMFMHQDEGSEMADGASVQAESEVSIPADMPHVPLYPDSVLQNVGTNNTDAERNSTLTLGTTAGVDDVIAWYRGALSADGWAVVGDKTVGGYVLLEGEKEMVKTFVQAAYRSDLGKTIITQRVRVR